MKKEDVIKQITTPLDAGAYPLPPYRFYNREYLNIVYKTDMESLRKIVPEPLEVTTPYVKFEIMKMPDVSGLGSYTECGQIIPVELNGEQGEYLHSMYVDSFPAIASGREISGYPKKLGKPNLYVDSDVLVGTLDYGTLRVATATMGYKHFPMSQAEALAEITKPTFMLKKIPGYNGAPLVCQLVRTEITDVEIKGAWMGPARLELFAHVLAPMKDLPVLEIVSASHIVTELSLSGASVVYDYLEEE
ncbi:acetoacetate decarboxylase [Lysinibacillus louembei]|uniref:Acetoacetate decarboxylase n=1 Tax=Lysinibacillus louembei TaxID=1470088 RepID=A0ABZ0RSE6_9BACI|nr:acetoacetate decarboxylase [Lysinibacillus louembei]WPK11055.1 acetoacetate decarboxylase [Lysinibacillus louembei]